MKFLKVLIIDILLCLGVATVQAQVISPPYYSWRLQEATTCANLTNGKTADLCRQSTDNTLWKCVPNAGVSGTCSTTGEWKQVGGSGGGG